MNEERIPKLSKTERNINKDKEPKIFDISEEMLDERECWPDCSPCSPSDECSPDIVCSPDMREDWGSCKPCGPTGISRSDYDDFNREYDKGWSNCNPCSPDGDCAPDFGEDGK